MIKKEITKINLTLEELFHSQYNDNNCIDENVFFTLFKMPKINELKEQFKRLFFHEKKKSSPAIYQISFTQFR